MGDHKNKATKEDQEMIPVQIVHKSIVVKPAYSLNATSNDMNESLLSNHVDDDSCTENEISKRKFSFSALKQMFSSIQHSSNNQLNRLSMQPKQAPIHPFLKCQKCVTRHDQKRQIIEEDMNTYIIQRGRSQTINNETITWNKYVIKECSEQ